MTHDDERPFICIQRGFKRFYGIEVEMIGRLIEDQEFGKFGSAQDTGKCRA